MSECEVIAAGRAAARRADDHDRRPHRGDQHLRDRDDRAARRRLDPRRLHHGRNVYGDEGVLAGAILVALLAGPSSWRSPGVQRLVTPRGLKLQRSREPHRIAQHPAGAGIASNEAEGGLSMSIKTRLRALFALLAAAVLAVGIAACGGDNDESSTGGTAAGLIEENPDNPGSRSRSGRRTSPRSSSSARSTPRRSRPPATTSRRSSTSARRRSRSRRSRTARSAAIRSTRRPR